MGNREKTEGREKERKKKTQIYFCELTQLNRTQTVTTLWSGFAKIL